MKTSKREISTYMDVAEDEDDRAWCEETEEVIIIILISPTEVKLWKTPGLRVS